MSTALTYDDIQLVPEYSKINSRKDINLNSLFSRRYSVGIPLIASPMDTVCDAEMAGKMMKMGGVGIIHRFMTIETQVKDVEILFELSKQLDGEPFTHGKIKKIPISAAVGANGDYFERAQALVNAGANVILIDVAHGHHENVRLAIDKIKSISPEIDVIAGNIATSAGAEDLQNWGADALRVGVGGGSLCTTRIKTGFGVPNVTSLEEIRRVAKVPIIADGGVRTSGDIAKALAVGASTVMLGSLLAGTEEAPGKLIQKSSGLYKRYRGAASLETKMAHGQDERNIEGESAVIPYKGVVFHIVEDLLDGVRSALSYAGADSIDNYKPRYVIVSNAGLAEAKPHLL